MKIRTTGNKKNRPLVVLTYAGDSSKLKPLVIFKRKTMLRIAKKHGVVVAVQQKGWMDENLDRESMGITNRRTWKTKESSCA